MPGGSCLLREWHEDQDEHHGGHLLVAHRGLSAPERLTMKLKTNIRAGNCGSYLMTCPPPKV
jgi:hypothetical protein